MIIDHPEEQYLSLLRDLLHNGDHREGRNGGVRSLFGAQMRFDLTDNTIPLLTTKRVHWKSVLVELLWFLRGDTNIAFLHEHGVTIWDEWADKNGDLGPVYGAQWRKWRTGKKSPFVITRLAPNGEPSAGYQPDITIDQIADVIRGLKTDPFGRRHIVSAWNPADIESMALPPCHCLFQFHVTTDGKLNCQLYQRSADVFLGVPFNIASYALLTMIVAREVGLKPGTFVHTLGDYHLYDNHVEQAVTQLARRPGPLPYVTIRGERRWDKLEPEDFELHHYHPQATIKAEVSK